MKSFLRAALGAALLGLGACAITHEPATVPAVPAGPVWVCSERMSGSSYVSYGTYGISAHASTSHSWRCPPRRFILD